MKKISAIVWSIFSISAALQFPAFSLPLVQRSAFVDEPNCYMQNQDGSLVNLNGLCSGRAGAVTQALEQLPNEVNALEVPIAGDTCYDFATRWEAQWHYVRSTAPVGLDGDRDGEACEGLTDEIREDGQKIGTNTFTNRWGYELWRGDFESGYYLRIFFNQDIPIFSTRGFVTGAEAIDHANCYYGEACSLPRISDRDFR
ncbi:MAG: hypothetical protein KME15_25770 [Drouetiella hepatica Uher 2000/2452]|jgi:hypothetical protein|uniref:Excalibur calcium-binding domain-containing protein n=1 Tax=Drouetiella hepatica Uher 2000/2452 TaxID=904376 RepID=A0A951QFV4_9CYAN|nr:hypothetical protein [Drouetiella hepatica Uher 2000/2452]